MERLIWTGGGSLGGSYFTPRSRRMTAFHHALYNLSPWCRMVIAIPDSSPRVARSLRFLAINLCVAPRTTTLPSNRRVFYLPLQSVERQRERETAIREKFRMEFRRKFP